MNDIHIRLPALAVSVLAAAVGPAAAQGQARAQLETAAVARTAAPAPSVAGVPAAFEPGYPDPYYPDGIGRQEAVRSCMRASFDSEKKTCLQAANAARFFDPAAARACGAMSFGSNIAQCLNAIANKTYVPEEVAFCANSSLDRGKLDCFRSAGRPYEVRPPYYPRPDIDLYILGRLRRIRANLEQGEVFRASAGIRELIMFVEDGMRGPGRPPRYP